MEAQRYGYDDANRAADIARTKLIERCMNPDQVNDGVILGSGLGGFERDHLGVSDRKGVSSPLIITFEEIFKKLGLPLIEGGAEGHAKRLVFNQLNCGDDVVAAQSGREHPYEDVDPKRATFWLRVLQLLGTKTLIGSNASGIVTPHTLSPRDVITVMDDIDKTGYNPLKGANDERFGPRFPHKALVYPEHVRGLLQRLAMEAGWQIKDGVYIRVSGPEYESAGDVYDMREQLEGKYKQGRKQPGDAERWRREPVGVVGMSSTYERAVINHAQQSAQHPAFQQGWGYLSVATNYSASLGPRGIERPSDHREVQEAAAIVQQKVGALVREAILHFQRERASKS